MLKLAVTMDQLLRWKAVQNGDSPMLSFAKTRIPTPPEAYRLMHPGDQVNVTVQVHDKISGIPPYFRAYDKHGNRLYINFLPLQGIFSSGDQLHLHRYISIELKRDVPVQASNL